MTTTTHSLGTIEHLDPTTLVIDVNVRPSAGIDPGFVQSIRENGVLVPVVASRDEQGNVLVRMGQRRTLGAREAGAASIPVYIVEGDDSTVERIIRQMAENDHRDGLTASDRAAAFQQLAFEGMSVTAIAKRTGTKAKEVKTAIAVAENPTAASAINEHPLTLDQAAVLIEFEDDEDTRDNLIATALGNPGQFAHAAQRARDDRARARAKAQKEAELAEAGWEILDRDRGYYETDLARLTELVTAEGERATVERIENVEGRCVYVNVGWNGDIHPIYYIRDPKAAGLHKANASGNAGGPMTDEQKAERRALIANNKAWASAETVRREWLAAFLARKTLPKDAAAFVATALTTVHSTVGHAVQNGNGLAHDLLGIQRGSYGRDNLAPLVERTPAKAAHVALAIVLGGIEDSTGKHTWRYPTERDAAYFRRLAAWGYALSDVEQIVIDTIDAKATNATIDQTDQDDQPDEVDSFDQVDGED